MQESGNSEWYEFVHVPHVSNSPLPEVSCVEDRTKVAFKEKHGGSRAVVGFQGCHGNAHSLPGAVDVKNAGMTNIQFNLYTSSRHTI